MGAVVSTAKLLFYATQRLRKTYEVVRKRIETPPGLPVDNPTLPLWTVPAAQIPTSEDHAELPEYADVVIVGSGITGTSFAYNVLTLQATTQVVMLEARAVCSGATGRNGGHINPPLYHDYTTLKEKHGREMAKVMLAFRQSHILEMIRVASQEDIKKQSQVRETEHLDVFTCPDAYAEAVENLAKWKADMPVESSSFIVHEGEEAIKKFHHQEKLPAT